MSEVWNIIIVIVYKKAISSSMSNKLLGWSVHIMRGNPTKSVSVNEVINKVKKKWGLEDKKNHCKQEEYWQQWSSSF